MDRREQIAAEEAPAELSDSPADGRFSGWTGTRAMWFSRKVRKARKEIADQRRPLAPAGSRFARHCGDESATTSSSRASAACRGGFLTAMTPAKGRRPGRPP